MTHDPARRRRAFIGAVGAASALFAGRAWPRDKGEQRVFTVVTFGDSILDCGRYNAYGVDPGQLLVRNDDRLFPDYRGRDLASDGAARLEHRARDGGRVDDLPRQAEGLRLGGDAVALITVGGNDLLGGLAGDTGAGLTRFERRLDAFVRSLRVVRVLLGTVYDPTFGDDSRNFLGVDARVARPNFNRVNEIIGAIADRHGQLADVHGHFLRGDPSWFTHTIEPSLRGASEIRAVFLPLVVAARAANGRGSTHTAHGH